MQNWFGIGGSAADVMELAPIRTKEKNGEGEKEDKGDKGYYEYGEYSTTATATATAKGMQKQKQGLGQKGGLIDRNRGIDSDLDSDEGEGEGDIIFKTDLVMGVLELGARLFEEMDYCNEARNVRTFGALYGSAQADKAKKGKQGIKGYFGKLGYKLAQAQPKAYGREGNRRGSGSELGPNARVWESKAHTLPSPGVLVRGYLGNI